MKTNNDEETLSAAEGNSKPVPDSQPGDSEAKPKHGVQLPHPDAIPYGVHISGCKMMLVYGKIWYDRDADVIPGKLTAATTVDLAGDVCEIVIR